MPLLNYFWSFQRITLCLLKTSSTRRRVAKGIAAAETGRLFKSLFIKLHSLSISQVATCFYAGARLSQLRSDPLEKQMPRFFQPVRQKRHGAWLQPAQQLGTAGGASPKPNSAALLGNVFPHSLEEEHPGHPMGCPPIWDSALFAHSLLTTWQIASLRQQKESSHQEWGWPNPSLIQLVKTHTTKNHQSEAPQICLTKGVRGGEGKREREISKDAGTRGVTVIMLQVFLRRASGRVGRRGCWGAVLTPAGGV